MKNTPRQIASTEQVDIIIDRLAQQLLDNYPSSPLFVVLLRGGAPFAAKLMFAITRLSPAYHPELDYMLVSTYGQNRTASQPVVVTDIAPTTIVDGRDVVILDDVIDRGITSDFVRELFMSRSARSVKLAVLANKTPIGRVGGADYVGLDTSDQWLIGMGLDDAKSGHEHYRWTESIWEI